MNSNIFLLIIIAALRVHSVYGQQPVTASVMPHPAVMVTDGIITVAVQVDLRNSNELLGSFTGVLSWNPSLLQYQSHSGVLSGFTGTVNAGSTSTGELYFTGANFSGAAGVFPVIQVSFKAQAAGDALIDLDFSAMAAAFTFTDLLPLLTIRSSTVSIKPDCSEILHLNGYITSGTYLAVDQIVVSDALVENGVNVILNAGQSIDFASDFEVKTGALFEAVISGCVLTVQSRE